MGLYRDFSKDDRETKIDRVDFITEELFKKAMGCEKIDDILKYAFMFTVIRGYNIRNVIGACWCQEMSLRYILAAKKLPQFKKAPGVFLDIEGVLDRRPKIVHDGKHFEHLIGTMVSQYTTSTIEKKPLNEVEFAFFSDPEPAQYTDILFIKVLAQKYSDTDILNIIQNNKIIDLLECCFEMRDEKIFEAIIREPSLHDYCKESNINNKIAELTKTFIKNINDKFDPKTKELVKENNIYDFIKSLHKFIDLIDVSDDFIAKDIEGTEYILLLSGKYLPKNIDKLREDHQIYFLLVCSLLNSDVKILNNLSNILDKLETEKFEILNCYLTYDFVDEFKKYHNIRIKRSSTLLENFDILLKKLSNHEHKEGEDI